MCLYCLNYLIRIDNVWDIDATSGVDIDENRISVIIHCQPTAIIIVLICIAF